jgi:hypothetical protein
MIPNIAHVIFGLSPDFGGKPFSIVHYLAIESLRQVNRPDRIYVYYRYEPSGEWWERCVPHVTPVRFDPPQSIGGRLLLHPAHQADVARLQILYEMGGIYVDLDTICVRSFRPLLDADCVLGLEIVNGHLVGLCNAVILASPGCSFLGRWLDGFDPATSLWQGFRSVGRDEHWNEYSVRYPAFLARRFRDEVAVEGPRSFFSPSWSDAELRELFEVPPDGRDDAYCHHLWESISWDRYLSGLTEERILAGSDMYSCLAKGFLRRRRARV